MATATRPHPRAWALLNLRTDRGAYLDCVDRPYLKSIIADDRPEHVCVACAQSGKTITYLTKTWFRLAHSRDPAFIPTAIYTFPTDSDVREFSAARAKPMIEASPWLAQEVVQLDNVGVKRGKSGWTVYFRGTFTERAALSIPAGILVHDELDRSRPDTLELYQGRTRDSADPHRYVFSTPTVPDYGVSGQWARSDQREWFWRCGSCNAHQTFAPMDGSIPWREQLDLEDECFRCYACHAEVPHAAVLEGEWIAQAPENADVAGYHISGIMPVRSTAKRLTASYHEAVFPELWANTHLGIPAVSGARLITADVIAFGDWRTSLKHAGPTYAGVDQGKKLDFVASDGRGRVIAVHRFDEWDEVRSAMRTLNVRMLVADSQPDARELQKMVGEFPGRVRLADYTLNTVDKDWFEVPRNSARVRIHRTGGLDVTAEAIILGADGGDVFPALPRQEEAVLVAQLCAAQRSTEVDARGIPRGVWRETSADHLRHAHLYCTVAAQIGSRLSSAADSIVAASGRYEANYEHV